MVRSLFWTALIGMALLSATLLAVEGGQRGSSSIVHYRLAEVATFLAFGIPFVGYLALRRMYVRGDPLDYEAGGRLFLLGVAVWAGLLLLLFLLSPDSQGKRLLQFLWWVLSSLIFVLPLGAWVLNAQARWNEAISWVAVLVAAALGLAFTVARFAVAETVLLGLGPWIAFAFALLLLCVFMLNFGKFRRIPWMAAHLVALIIAVVYGHFIFFQGIFLGGGLALHMLFLNLLVFGTAIAKAVRLARGRAIASM